MNTSPEASSVPAFGLSGDMPTRLTSLTYLLQDTIVRYRPELEMLWVLLTYSPFFGSLYRYTSSPKRARARRYPYLLMLTHILTGCLIVLRYHARYAALRVWPRPDTIDLALFTVFNLSSALLEMGRIRVTASLPVSIFRAGFEVAIMMHGICFAAAWVPWGSGGGGGRDPVLFRAAVKFINWFASFRSAGYLIAWVDPRLAKGSSIFVRNEVNMIASGSFAMWESGIPAGVPIFLLSIAVLVIVKRTLAKVILSFDDKNPLKKLLHQITGTSGDKSTKEVHQPAK